MTNLIAKVAVLTPPRVVSGSELVAGDVGPEPIRIGVPRDLGFLTSQLTATVTALPTDGAVLLSDGVTPVTVGENLSVAQLTTLEFQPSAGLFNASSTFAYTVADPNGSTATGRETLRIAPDRSPPKTSAAHLTVTGNSGATALNIAAPIDSNFSASQLSVRVTALPTDGVVLLSDGTTPLKVGETLTVAQLTGLTFIPTAGHFNQTSTFSYTVTDPANLLARGSDTLTIARDTAPPVTTNSILTVASNGGATAVNIPAPNDPNYAASQLTVTVKTLPRDGTILLSNGTTPVRVGETLTVAQLTGLEFKPTTGAFGQSSTFTYSVKDPSGLSATGSETLTVTADTAPPVTIDPTLTVAENAAATAVNIPAPSDPNYAVSQLTVTVTALPNDGTMLLSNGTTPVTVGETLTVAQLTGLEFKPTTGAFGQSSTFTYSVKDPSGLSATGSETLTVTADTAPPVTIDPTLTVAENAAATAVNIPAPSDPNYAVSQLTVTVTALPNDGTMLLSNGTTPVTVGETLTVAQLTGLEFKPTTGAFGQSSTFTYSVKDPSGLSATGSETLTVTADTAPPVTIDPTLTVAENAAATAVNIPAPSDPNYAVSQLTVTVTALPNDGTMLLSNGTTPVTVGETLTVAQLTGLEFKPTTGAFGQSSTFTYSVKDPSGLSATGSETLTVETGSGLSPSGATLFTGSTTSLVTSVGSWTFGTSTGAGGEQILLNGQSAAGGFAMELLIGNQDQLYADNTLGAWYEWENSAWSPVANPTGIATSPPQITDVSIAVAENGAATAINIPAPTDPNYAAQQLMVKVVALPTDGTVLLSNGTTPVTVGEALTVAQLTALEFSPMANASGQTSTLTYAVTDPSDVTVIGTDTLSINASAQSSASSTTTGSQGNTVTPTIIIPTPTIIRPSQPGDIVGLQLQNTASAAENSGYVTFGEVFKDGAVNPADSLVARINGVNYAVQMDVKSTNTDGSVSDAVLTLDAPSIAADSSISVMLAKGTAAAAPSPTAPSPQSLLNNLLGGSDNTTVSVTFSNADGSTTTESTSAAQALQQALSNGTVQTWLSGPEVNQYDVTTTVDNGNLKVEFDIQAEANGTTSTDVIFDNSWMNSPGKTDLNYNVSIGQGGKTVYSANNVQQYLYSLWNYQVNSAGTISPNLQYDVSYLESTGAIQAYDTSVAVAASTVASYAATLNASNTGPLGTADVTTYMGTTGGRDDIGPQPAWVSEWLLSQSATAEQTMMANADAAGGIPWHFTDESTGEPINPITYSNFWDDGRGYEFGNLEPANGLPDTAAGGGQVSADGDPWSPDSAHMPDLNYVPYLITGSPYQLELLQAQADFAISSTNPAYAQQLIPGSDIPYGIINTQNQTRAIAWDIRAIAEAAYATPDSDPLKSAYTSELQSTMASMVQQYITDSVDSTNGQIQGFIQGANSPSVSPWQQGYIVTALAEVAGMNIPQASADAVEMLQYMNNFVSGLYTNSAAGFDPIEGPAYWLNTTDPTTGTPYTTWAELYQGNLASGNIPTPTDVFPNFPGDTQGGYAEIAMAALADEITYTGSPQAIQAYGYVVSQIANAFVQGGASEAAAFASNPEWDIVPKLPDGTYLTASQMQIDTSSNNVTLTAQGADSLLSVVGGGTDTLNGGSGTVDLLYGGTGSDTLVAGTGNDYLFGGSGASIFVDNVGNNYMQAGSGANTFKFEEANSGHDTIVGFDPSVDQLVFATNLNGNGITTVSQMIAGATVTNGNTVFHLGPQEDVTLAGIASPSSLTKSITFV